MKKTKLFATVLNVSILSLSFLRPGFVFAVPGTNVRLSTDSTSTQSTGGTSYDPVTSSTGQFTAFVSAATNLVASDTNAARDVFVKDKSTGAVERVSISSTGTQANGDSLLPAISANGRYVTFYSDSTNLVANDTTGAYDVYLYDRTNDILELISVNTSGNAGDSSSIDPDVSDDGRFVTFQSNATDLTSGDTNAAADIFVRDRKLGSTKRVSVSTSGTQTTGTSSIPNISCDGRYVVFSSLAANLVASDSNGVSDVFIVDRVGDVVENLTISGNAASARPVISCDGKFVTFASTASNLVSGDTNGDQDIFLMDREASTFTRVSVSTSGIQGNAGSVEPSMTEDGRYIVFGSDATNLVSGDTNATHDVFLHDRINSTTERVSINSTPTQGNGFSYSPVISADRAFVSLASEATNLITGDTNALGDVFSAATGISADACVE